METRTQAIELLAQIEQEAVHEESMTPEQIKQEQAEKKAAEKLEQTLSKISEDIKLSVDKTLEGKFGAIKKLTHKDFNWKNVDISSNNIIDLGDVKLEAEKSHEQKMQQANDMLAQAGIQPEQEKQAVAA